MVWGTAANPVPCTARPTAALFRHHSGFRVTPQGGGLGYHQLCTDEETEARRGKATKPRVAQLIRGRAGI